MKTMLPLTLCFLIGILLHSTAIAEDTEVSLLKREVELLKAEIANLKKENELLKKENADLKKAARAAMPKTRDANDGEYRGILWEIDMLGDNNSVRHTLKMYAADNKLFYDFKEVGSYAENGTIVRIDITKAPEPQHNGSGRLVRFSENPLMYAGRYGNKAGKSTKVRLRVIAD